MAPTYAPANPVWSGVPGWCDFENVYQAIVQRCKSGDCVVEVGSFLGRSACFMGETIKQSGKAIILLCVDTWPSTYRHPDGYDIEAPFETFYANVRQAQLLDIIVPIRSTSVRAASFVRDNLACVFIDGGHNYEDCRDDIEAWFPKVIHGGLLAGHDYNEAFPGVIKAVDEAFKKTHSRDGNCWLYNKP